MYGPSPPREIKFMSEILSVKQFTERVKGSLERTFPFVWVSGEVTNLGRPGSGHVYFSLRDGEDLLNCVWFKGKQREKAAFDPLTGEVYEDGPRQCLSKRMENGDMIACAGAVTVYGPRGAYQLLVEMAQETGQGDLLRELERLKRELAAKGWFAQERKRAIPENPARVVVITAPTGAAVQDFVRIAGERGTGTEIRIIPVPVQGAEAAVKITQAVHRANADGWAQVVVIIRGGGSLEDLWAFNNAGLAEAIVGSAIPVLTGIGHEVDTSIADLAADLRAATPSHAAQILWREREWYAQRLDGAQMALAQTMNRKLEKWAGLLTQCRRGLDWLSPEKRLERAAERHAALVKRLPEVMAVRLKRLEQEIFRLERELPNRVRRQLDSAEHRLVRLEARLGGLDPHAPLQRGYALVRSGERFLRRAADAAPGDTLYLCLRDGDVAATVTGIQMKDNEHA